MTDQPPGAGLDVDTLLKATLTDDLPPAVEDRLKERVELFLTERREAAYSPWSPAADWLVRVLPWPSRWPVGRALRVAASAALVVCGVALHESAGPRAFAAPVAHVQESVAVWTAIRSAASMQCSAAAREDLGSPAEFADRVYRRWLLVSSGSDESGSLLLTFESPADSVGYELHVDRRSMLPSRIVMRRSDPTARPGGQLAGYDADCRWETRVAGGRTDGQQ